MGRTRIAAPALTATLPGVGEAAVQEASPVASPAGAIEVMLLDIGG